MESVVKAIIKTRKSKGLSQENIATQLGITKGNYNRLEKGHSSLTVERLIKISKIFDCELGELIGIRIDSKKEVELIQENELLKLYLTTSKNVILKLIKTALPGIGLKANVLNDYQSRSQYMKAFRKLVLRLPVFKEIATHSLVGEEELNEVLNEFVNSLNFDEG